MRKRKIIISVVVAVCVLAGVFFVMRFGVMGRIYNAISRYVVQDKAESGEEAEEELRYETFLDKDGNEIVVEMRKIIVLDEDSNEVEFWVETAEPIIIYDYTYKGKLEKIEDNKIYFMVDKKEKEGTNFVFEDVEDYQIIFDIDTYDFECDPNVGHDVCDSLEFINGDFLNGVEFFYSAGELEFLVDEYLIVHDGMVEDNYIGEKYKSLVFYLQ